MEGVGTWADMIDVIKAFGLLKGTFLVFFILAHAWIYKMYLGRLSDRQDEINRLAKDNHEYRDRFLAFLDAKLEQTIGNSRNTKK